jgi:F420-dependent oxidoreductase-like protein
MKIGLQLVSFNWGGLPTGTTLARIGQAADSAGFSSLWALDHFFQMGRAEDPMLEGYSTLAFLAAVTQKVTLGTLVTGVVYRHPGALVKTVSTLDALSGGRAWLGIGAAWYEREARGLGLPFPPLAQRFEQLEETLHIAHQMWAGEVRPYHGQHFHLTETLDQPLPPRRPRILIGGGGEKKTLRLVAQYADACNFDGGLGIDGLRHKLDVLRGHCAAVGRGYDSLEKTVVTGVGGRSAAELVDYCASLRDIGIDHVIFNAPDTHTLAPLDLFGAHVIPTVSGW